MPRDPNDRASSKASGSEEALIAEFWAPLASGMAGAYGLMDDCATIAPPPGEELVVTTDALIAGMHFLADEDPGAVGWKALAVNVSDLASKGATPLAYVMNVALPALDRTWLQAFTSGLSAAQDAFGCHLIGGDTDRTPGPLSVSITAFGTVPEGRMVRRSTSKPGDHVYVTGSIGDATLGLALRRDSQLQMRWGLDDAAASYLVGRFSRPRPPVAAISALRSTASAAMDISDGLVKDFDRLCRASGVAGTIEASRVPLSDAAQRIVNSGGARIEQLLTGGEDYEVLATVAPSAAPEFERLAAAASTRVSCIGIVTSGRAGAVTIGESGAELIFTSTGWDHFLQP